MKNKENMSIQKMIEYIDKIINYNKNYLFEEFVMNDMLVEATVFCLSQIGELVKNISEDTIAKYPYRWKTLKGLRNRIVHDYDGIQLYSVWKIATDDIFELKEDLMKIIDNEEEG